MPARLTRARQNQNSGLREAMSFGPYAPYIVTSYLAVILVVAFLIAWIGVDYRNQRQHLREFEDSGVARRSGRRATEIR
jgi:heme exporter protein D